MFQLGDPLMYPSEYYTSLNRSCKTHLDRCRYLLYVFFHFLLLIQLGVGIRRRCARTHDNAFIDKSTTTFYNQDGDWVGINV